MEKEKLLELISTDIEKLQSEMEAAKGDFDYGKLKAQLDPYEHSVMKNDPQNRPDKVVTALKEDGTKFTKTVKVTRIPLPYQQLITNYAVFMLVGKPIELQYQSNGTTEDDFMEVFLKTWRDNKLDFKSQQLARLTFSETEAAEIWYEEDAPEGYWDGTKNEGNPKRLRMRVLANKYGDSLYPLYNKYGDMVAFGRSYLVKENEEDVKYLDLYTDENNYYFVNGEPAPENATEANAVKKIPVIYYYQEKVEWYYVQPLIERQELSRSRHGDSNDYSGNPAMAVYGKILGFADKGEEGKVYQLENGAKMEMIGGVGAPESVKMEQEKNERDIFYFTHTPYNLEFATTGNVDSGAAMDRVLLHAQMKAAGKEETFGESIQRRINLLKAMLIQINPAFEVCRGMEITPKFQYFKFEDKAAQIDTLMAAMSGDKPILSQETAIALNPLVEDTEGELQRIKSEQGANDSNPTALDRLMNAV